jgi:Leucine-rich repeat (LRR) protein
MTTQPMTTFTLLNPEASLAALQEWGGEDVALKVKDAEDEWRALGVEKRTARGTELRIFLRSGFASVPHPSADSATTIEVRGRQVWVNGAPLVGLSQAGEAVGEGPTQVVALREMPRALPRNITVFTILKGDSVTSLDSLEGLVELERLDLAGCKALTDLTPLRGLTALQSINLSSRWKLPDLTPLQGLTALHSLDLSSCPNLTDLTPLKGLTALQSIDLHGCPLTDLTPLQGLTALQSIDLHGCPLTDLTPLQGLAALQSISLAWCKALTDLNGLQGLTALQSIDLRFCNALTDFRALRGLTALQSINLQECWELTNLAPLQGLTALQSIVLRWCRGLTDLNGLPGLTALQSLDLSYCEALTDLTPLQGLTALQKIDLEGCTALTDLTPLQGLTALQKIDLEGCTALTDLTPLQGLTALQSIALAGCRGLTDLTPLQGLTALHSLDLVWCRALTHIAPLLSCPNLTKLNLENSGNIRDLDALTACTQLRQLTWTETAAPRAVLAATAVARQDAEAVRRSAKDWLSSVRLSKAPNTFGLRLVHAFALGGDAPWAAEALTALASELRERASKDEDPLVIAPDTWAAWANAALALSDDDLHTALRAALTDLRPDRELLNVLTPALTALADLGPATPKPRRPAPDWLVPLVRDVLAPLERDEDHARRAAPGAAVFFAGFGLDAEVRRWLEHGTHPDAAVWRDHVWLALLQRALRNQALDQARDLFREVATPRLRDEARALLAQALVARLPAEAAQELEAIEDDALRAKAAKALQAEPAMLATPAGLYALVLAQQHDPDALGDTLRALVEACPHSPLVEAVRRDLAPPVAAAPDPLPDLLAAPAWREEVAGRKWDAFTATLPDARALLAEAIAARAVAAGLLDEEAARETVGRIG